MLAFEGEFFSLNQGWDTLSKDAASVDTFLKANLFPVWSECLQCADLLYSYIPETFKTNTSLQVTGFDNQIGFKYSKEHLKSSLDQYLRKKQVAYVESERYERFLYHTTILGLPSFKSAGREKIEEWESGLRWFIQETDTVLAQLGSEEANEFYYLTLESLREFAKSRLKYSESGNRHSYSIPYSIRDKQMARNLQWLAQSKYPDEKIIVWAANAHIIKNAASSIKSNRVASTAWMGGDFTSDSLNNAQTYVLGFSSKQGTYKRTTVRGEPKPVPSPGRKGFETWLEPDLLYGFVDFKPFRAQHPGYNKMYMMKSWQMSATGAWHNIFDGIFYIRDMTPCERIMPVAQ